MNFQTIWKKSKKALALLLAITLFFGGWGNYDFSVFAAGGLTVVLDDASEIYTGSAISLPEVTSVTDGTADVTSYTSVWKDSKGNEVSGSVTTAGVYTLTVKETATEKVTDPDTGVETEETKETGRDGSATFTVKQFDLAECTVSADKAVYTGGEITPNNVVVLDKDGNQVDSALYVATYSNNVDAGEGKITVNAADAHTAGVVGTAEGTFTIEQKELSVQWKNETFTYDGKTTYFPSVTVNGDKTISVLDTEMEIVTGVTVTLKTSATSVDAGEYKVTLELKDSSRNYKLESTEFEYSVAKKNLGADGITLEVTPASSTVNVNKDEYTPAILLKDGDVELASATNSGYKVLISKKEGETEVSVDEITEVGTYTVLVEATPDNANYTGSISKTFTLAFATGGTASLPEDKVLDNDNIFAEEVIVTAGDNYEISKELEGTYAKTISFTSTPTEEERVVYLKDSEGYVTEFKLPEFQVYNNRRPEISNVAVSSDEWERSKTITVNVSNADYGVYYTAKTDFATLTDTTVSSIPEGLEPANKSSDGEYNLSITSQVLEDTTYRFYAIDKAGNISAESTVVINKIDPDIPEVKVDESVSFFENGIFWKGASASDGLEIPIELTDEGSGIESVKVVKKDGTEVTEDEVTVSYNQDDKNNTSGTLLVKASGEYKVIVSDSVNDTNSVGVAEFTVTEDVDAPQVTLLPDGAMPSCDGITFLDDKNVYWFDKNVVKVPAELADVPEDATDKSSYTIYFSTNETDWEVIELKDGSFEFTLNEGKETYYVKAVDVAGNEEPAKEIILGYDASKPEVDGSLTQVNENTGWINSDSLSAGALYVEFSVPASDEQTGIKEIAYRQISPSEGEYVVLSTLPTLNDGKYVFKTNESYADGQEYGWEIRVTNNVGLESVVTVPENSDAQIDVTEPNEEVYIKFLSDIEGANANGGSTADNKWSSKIDKFLKDTWDNIWGNKTVTFEVYVKDNLSGIQSIEMCYTDEKGKEIALDLGDEVTGVRAFNVGDENSVDDAEDVVKDNKGYTVYTGEISLSQSDAEDILVKDFQIKSMLDKAGNKSSSIVLKNAGKDVIYLDNVAPELVSVTIGEDEESVNSEDRYLYKENQSLKLTVKERFFNEEGVKYPEYKLNATNANTGEPVESVWEETTVGTEASQWKKVNGTSDQWEITIPLEMVAGCEYEYQLMLSYADSSENKLVGAEGVNGVTGGVFTSKTFVIDNSNPKLTAYSINAATDCVVDGSAVYANVEGNDLKVEFTIDDNEMDYELSKSNLVVNVYNVDDTENAVLTLTEDALAEKDKFTGRSHKYSFEFDGEDKIASKYYVEITYKDALGLPLVDYTGLSAVENKEGTLKSEEYIIDHVAPVFEISYDKEATNVVRIEDGVASDGTTPRAQYRAYYNSDIIVTMKFEEKYADSDENNALDHFGFELYKDGANEANITPTWTKDDETGKYVATFTIYADTTNHSTDGDYYFVVSSPDCAGNLLDVSKTSASNEATSEVETSNEVNTYRSPVLVMDTTAPVVTTSYSATPAQTLTENEIERDYFNAKETETVFFNIEVSDRSIRYQELKNVLGKMKAVNVDGDEISDTQLAKDIDDIVDTDVQHTMGSEDQAVWTLPLTLSTEANYDIPVNFTDLAGNEAKVVDPNGAEYKSEGYVEHVTFDKELLEDNIFIKFEGNVVGSNITNSMLNLESFDDETGTWISRIYAFVKGAWDKLWGNRTISFELYLRDEISGIYAIEMQYQESGNENVIKTYKFGELNDNEYVKSEGNIKLRIQDDGSAVKDDKNGKTYVVYKGSITIPEDKDVIVSDFTITTVKDKALNEETGVVFASEREKDILHLDDVAPELISVKMKSDDSVVVNTDVRYYYNTSQTLILTIDERFFGQEDTPIYPEYRVIKVNKTTGDEPESEKFTVSTAEQWNSVKNENGKVIEGQYYIEIPLDLVDKSEVEYQVELKYQDAAGHALVAGGDISNGVKNGTFKSKTFVIDAVAPVLSSVVIGEKMVDTDSMYFYDDAKFVEITIDERYFGKETTPVIPSYVLTTKRILSDGTEPVVVTAPPVETTIADAATAADAVNVWRQKENTNQYTLKVALPKQTGYETEYEVELYYSDASGNKLVNISDEYTSVEDGTFTSKTFVIDDIAPELVDYSVTGTGCYVENASVLKNDTANNDLVVNFTINDNPTYYAKSDEHVYSQENLTVKLYKEGSLVKTLQDGVDGVDALKKTVDGRNHKYSFVYDEEGATTQDKFQVTVEYKDVVNHLMLDEEDAVTPGSFEPGKYTSEEYIIDHVKPVFGITYSDATNVVAGNVDELTNRLHSETPEAAVANGKKPRVGYTAYYNTDIQVTITIDEKYENIVVPKTDGSNEVDIVDCDENKNSYPLDHYTFAITKNGAVIQPEITWSHDEEGHKASFVIKAEKDHSNDGDYQFVVTYQDCATNKMDASAVKASNEQSGTEGVYASPILVMDTTAPVLSSVSYDTINAFNTVKEKDFVNAPTTMTFTMSEKNPTPTSNYSITTLGALVADWSGVESERKTTLETVPMRNNGDEQTVSMYIEDWAGNKVVLANDDVRRSKVNTSLTTGTFTDKFTVDTVVPEIELEYVTYSPNRPNINGIDYFKNPITVKVTVDEHNFDKDLFKQPVIKTSKDVVYQESEWSKSGDIHVKTFTFSKDNQYDLSIIGTDNAKNKLNLTDAKDMAEKLDAANSKVSLSVAVDSTIPAIGDNVKPVIVIKPATPQNKTIDGQALYNTDVTYEVVVYDPLLNDYASGINDITFKVTGEDGTAATCDVKKQGGIENGTGVTVKRVGGDVKELARGVDNKYTFNVTISSTVFNTNGIVLWVGANDVATTHNEKKVDPISIDITKPKVVVSYDNNDVSNQKYFHDVRTATVTVTERNFSDDCLQFIVNGGDKKLDFSLSKAGSGNRDDAVWVAHYTFAADQDYTVDVEVQDRAKNVGSVEYVGEAPQEFTVDMTKPKISVEYDNHSVLNELYYKDARTATITIEEHNFDADDVIIELTAKDGGSPINTPGVSSWSSDGDYHRATIHYNYDGEFTFDIDFMDLATNEADDYDMDHFIVDLTAPELEIFDIEHMSANNGVVRPGVRYWDTNYDADGTVVVMTGYNNGIVEMTGARDITANGVEFKLDDFEYVQSMDDIYTMNATVYDLAGNSSEATVMFSVNRFGSVYTFDKETAALIGENGKYYTNKEQQLVITETNVDTLEFKEITLNLNGKLVTLKEGVDFTVSLDGNETTWKQYTYKINAENFVEEGTYILTIYSEDRATNTSDNNSKGKKIEFVVDKTNPSLLLSGIEDSGQYRTSNKEVLIDVEDNVRLSKVVVTVDGEEVAVFDAAQIDEANGRLSVSVKDSSDWQLVEVTAYDAAGNIQSHEQMRVLVSANIFVQWYRNTPLFWGSIGGTAVLAGLLWWFLIGKKKKKADEEQQVK